MVALLDLILANKEELDGYGKVRNRLCCSDCEIVELRILRGGNKTKSRISDLDFRKADCPVQDLIRGIPRDIAHERSRKAT